MLTSAASADVGWIVQSGGTIGATVSIHLPAFDSANPSNPDPNSDTYVPPIEITTIAQTDVGTSGDPALGKAQVNSLAGVATGYFKTVGNDFTTSLDFGKGPAKATAADLTVKAADIGTFFPSTIETGTPGAAENPTFDANNNVVWNFGTAKSVNSAGTLWTQTPLTGYNALTGNDFSQSSRDNGRVATYGLQTLPTTAAPLTVTAGAFQTESLVFVGTVGLALSVALAADPGGLEGVPSLSLVLNQEAVGLGPVANDLTGAAAVGHITRGGVGVNTGPKYIMTAPFSKDYVLLENEDGSAKLTVHLSIAMISHANLVEGDANFDGVVDIQDITLMANKWLTTDSAHLGQGDANGDGVVDIQDITMAANHWLQTPPPLGGGGSVTAVPEPGSLVLLSFGAVGSLLIARRRARR